MPEHAITLEWSRNGAPFDYHSYSRDHSIIYGDHNTRICASAAPEFHGNPACLDPEQAFVAALASCHMLTFLALASKKGFMVDRYIDKSSGELGRNEQGRTAMIKITLRPEVMFGGEKMPADEEYQVLHDRAHSACFIANSIASCVKVVVKPEKKRSNGVLE